MDSTKSLLKPGCLLQKSTSSSPNSCEVARNPGRPDSDSPGSHVSILKFMLWAVLPRQSQWLAQGWDPVFNPQCLMTVCGRKKEERDRGKRERKEERKERRKERRKKEKKEREREREREKEVC
jgi:hypothetical protein